MKPTVEELAGRYRDNIFAAAFHICKNAADADDIVQETFLQYYVAKNEFDSETHIRAWLIRVAVNKAKNVNRSFWRQNKVPLEEYMESLAFETPKEETLFEAVMRLPQKYRIVIHLYYYEDYAVREIAQILRLKESNVKVRLSRGRKLLKEALKEDWEDDE
ncbi:MAG: sigma-70 family RNA polymerase sigma factor [Eubacterium sp.]|nr:sigma-70 family RNA polymerase sigma factor [Eubacterium sp.]